MLPIVCCLGMLIPPVWLRAKGGFREPRVLDNFKAAGIA
jgi:hypothetical protein